MMDEQGTRFAVLLEDMDRKLSVVAEAVVSHDKKLIDIERTLNQRMDELDVKVVGIAVEMRELKAEVGKLGTKVDHLEGKVDHLEGKVDHLEAFAIEAAPRLERIESHLALPQPLPRREPPRPAQSKHHRRKPTKRS
jgi:predicted nuclease with TOPRIM domain